MRDKADEILEAILDLPYGTGWILIAAMLIGLATILDSIGRGLVWVAVKLGWKQAEPEWQPEGEEEQR